MKKILVRTAIEIPFAIVIAYYLNGNMKTAKIFAESKFERKMISVGAHTVAFLLGHVMDNTLQELVPALKD